MTSKNIPDTPRPPGKVRILTPGVNDLETLAPQIAIEMHGVDPSTVLAGSTKNVPWKCSLCSNEWSAAPRSRSKSYYPEPGCPDCARKRAIERRSKKMSLAEVYPALAQELKNPDEAKEYSYGSHTELTWICPREHEYKLTVNRRVNGRECPYCSFRELLPGFNDLETLFPKISAELVVPDLGSQLLANTDEMVEWTHTMRDGEKHYWETTVKRRTYEDNTGCLVCAGRTVQVGINDFNSKFLKGSKLLWSESNDFSPQSITYGSNAKVSLVCDQHERENVMTDIAKNFSKGDRVCQDCRPDSEKFVSQPERDILAYFTETFPDAKVEGTVRRFIDQGVYEIDILVDDWLAIDFNGTFWHREGYGKPFGYHVKKRRAVESLGFVFVEVLEENWLEDRDSILRDLAANVREGPPQFDPH